jgi:[protein-PII] uridylyltransferase
LDLLAHDGFVLRSVPHWLAGLQHPHDAFLRLGVVQQRAEAVALQRVQVLLGDERAGVDIEWAKITTMGSSVIDVFAVSGPGVEAARQTLEADLYAVLPAPPPAKPVAEAG